MMSLISALIVFDEILQVLVLENRTKAASRARTGCGSNQ